MFWMMHWAVYAKIVYTHFFHMFPHKWITDPRGLTIVHL